MSGPSTRVPDGGTSSRRKRRKESSRSQRQTSHNQNAGGPGGSHQGIIQGGLQGTRGFTTNNSMPPPGMHPHGPQLTGMGLSARDDEDAADYILDDVDHLTARDIAIARYKRNHELLNVIFDARRIDSLAPSPSPYASSNASELRTQLQSCVEQIEDCKEAHTQMLTKWQGEQPGHELMLHASNKRIRLQIAEREVEHAQSDETDQYDEDGKVVPAWARNASTGTIIGVGYIRASTPEEVRRLLPMPVESEVKTLATAPPGSSTAPEQASAAVPKASSNVAGNATLQHSAAAEEVSMAANGDALAVSKAELTQMDGTDEQGDDVGDDGNNEAGDDEEDDVDDDDDDVVHADADADADADSDVDADADGVEETVDADVTIDDAVVGQPVPIGNVKDVADFTSDALQESNVLATSYATEDMSSAMTNVDMSSTAADALFADGLVDQTSLHTADATQSTPPKVIAEMETLPLLNEAPLAHDSTSDSYDVQSGTPIDPEADA